MRYTWRLTVGALCTAIALAIMAGPAAAALSGPSVHSTKVTLLDDDDVEVCVGDECEELEDVDKVELNVYAWFLNSSRKAPDKPRLIEVACPIGAAQGVAVAVVAEEDGWLYVLAAAKGRSSFSDIDVVSTVNLGPALEWVRGGDVVLVSACADTKDRSRQRDRGHRDKHDRDGRDDRKGKERHGDKDGKDDRKGKERHGDKDGKDDKDDRKGKHRH